MDAPQDSVDDAEDVCRGPGVDISDRLRGRDRADRDERPEKREPPFGALRGAVFDGLRCNAPDRTRRLIADGRRAPRIQRVVWSFTRGPDVAPPRTWTAVDEDGGPLGDHELITVDVG